MNNQNWIRGKNEIFNACIAGRSIGPFVNELLPDESSAAQTMLEGAVEAAMELIAKGRSIGVTFHKKYDPGALSGTLDAVFDGDLAVARLRYEKLKKAGDTVKVRQFNILVLSSLEQMRYAKSVSFSRREDTEAATAIKIVSMPDRLTTSEVERDGKGNIKTTTQTERDVP